MNEFWWNVLGLTLIPSGVLGFMAGLVWLDIKVQEKCHDDDDC